MKIIELDEVDSTNEFCKRYKTQEDIIVTAKRQSGGKGTKGRSFLSEDGGLYISVMRRFNNFAAGKAFEIMIDGCVAVCKTLENFNIPARIRWANDVLVGDKKICGTLIENTFSGGYITRSIVGSGINVNNNLAPEIESIATSMKKYLNKTLDLDTVREEFIKNFSNKYSVSDYKKYIDWLNKPVKIITENEEKIVTAIDVLEDGRLAVDDGGKILKISSGEVSLRL